MPALLPHGTHGTLSREYHALNERQLRQRDTAAGMRHLKEGRKFGREQGSRHALIKGLADAFFARGTMRTTEAKAKELRPVVEKYITRGKNPTLANRRLLISAFSPATAGRIIARAGAMRERKGGYTRIIKTGQRLSDSARMAIIELV